MFEIKRNKNKTTNHLFEQRIAIAGRGEGISWNTLTPLRNNLDIEDRGSGCWWDLFTCQTAYLTSSVQKWRTLYIFCGHLLKQNNKKEKKSRKKKSKSGFVLMLKKGAMKYKQ